MEIILIDGICLTITECAGGGQDPERQDRIGDWLFSCPGSIDKDPGSVDHRHGKEERGDQTVAFRLIYSGNLHPEFKGRYCFP